MYCLRLFIFLQELHNVYFCYRGVFIEKHVYFRLDWILCE